MLGIHDVGIVVIWRQAVKVPVWSPFARGVIDLLMAQRSLPCNIARRNMVGYRFCGFAS